MRISLKNNSPVFGCECKKCASIDRAFAEQRFSPRFSKGFLRIYKEEIHSQDTVNPSEVVNWVEALPSNCKKRYIAGLERLAGFLEQQREKQIGAKIYRLFSSIGNIYKKAG